MPALLAFRDRGASRGSGVAAGTAVDEAPTGDEAADRVGKNL